MRSARTEECGAATLVVVALSALLVLAAVTVAALGGLLVSQRRAAAAADLAALAGATAIQHGGAGCPAARRTAARNGARMTACATRRDEVSVQVGVSTSTLLDRVVSIRASAVAGPVPRR